MTGKSLLSPSCSGVLLFLAAIVIFVVEVCLIFWLSWRSAGKCSNDPKKKGRVGQVSKFRNARLATRDILDFLWKDNVVLSFHRK